MYRDQHFNYERRCGDKLDQVDVAWTQSIVSINGAHYHFWFPRTSRRELELSQTKAKRAAQHVGDPVSFSYDFLPEAAVG